MAGTITEFPISTATATDSLPQADIDWLFDEIVGGAGAGFITGAHPSNTGAQNSTAINAALAQGGTWILPYQGTYTIASTLSFIDTSALDLNGNTLLSAAGTRFSMFENEQWSNRAVGVGSGVGSGNNSNIRIFNGTVDFNTDNTGTVVTDLDEMCMRFANVDKLEIDVEFIDSGFQTASDKGKYCALIYNCTNVVLNCDNFQTGSDGFHVSGSVDGLYIKNANGFCHDDMIAILIGDFAAYVMNDLYGDMKNITIDRANGDDTGQALLKYGGGRPFGDEGTFTAVAGTDIITTVPDHGRSNGDTISFSTTGTLPAGLELYTRYFVISATTSTYQVALSEGGSAVDITDTGTGTHSWGRQFIFRNVAVNVLQGTSDNAPVKTVSEPNETPFFSSIQGMIADEISISSFQCRSTGGQSAFRIQADEDAHPNRTKHLFLGFKGTYDLEGMNGFIITPSANSFTLIDKITFSNGNIIDSSEGQTLTFFNPSSDEIEHPLVLWDNMSFKGLSQCYTQPTGITLASVHRLSNVDVDSCGRFANLKADIDIHMSNVTHNNLGDSDLFTCVDVGPTYRFYGDSTTQTDRSTINTDLTKTCEVFGDIPVRSINRVTPISNGRCINVDSGVVTTPNTGYKLGHWQSDGTDWVQVISNEVFP